MDHPKQWSQDLFLVENRAKPQGLGHCEGWCFGARGRLRGTAPTHPSALHVELQQMPQESEDAAALGRLKRLTRLLSKSKRSLRHLDRASSGGCGRCGQQRRPQTGLVRLKLRRRRERSRSTQRREGGGRSFRDVWHAPGHHRCLREVQARDPTLEMELAGTSWWVQ